MAANPLQPGERVVELAGLAQSAAIFAGAVVGAITTWFSKRAWTASLAAFVVGGVAGFAVGFVVARIFYRNSGGMTTVVRVGSAALPSAFGASLTGAIFSALVIAGLSILLVSAQAQSAFTWALVCGALIGVMFACLASLT